jgi:hypothetical protein
MMIFSKLVLRYSCPFNLLRYSCPFNLLRYSCPFNILRYSCQFNILRYSCPFNLLRYSCPFNILRYSCPFNILRYSCPFNILRYSCPFNILRANSEVRVYLKPFLASVVCGLSDQLYTMTILYPLLPSSSRLGRPQCRSGLLGEERSYLSLLGIKSRFLRRSFRILIYPCAYLSTMKWKLTGYYRYSCMHL